MTEQSSPTKALSIRQPWAWLIVNGYKDIENRDRRTKHRGPIYVHAAQGMTRDEYGEAFRLCGTLGITLPRFHELERGGIVGRVDIVDCVDHSESDWFFGPRGYVLANASPSPFMPCRGALGLFKPAITDPSNTMTPKTEAEPHPSDEEIAAMEPAPAPTYDWPEDKEKRELEVQLDSEGVNRLAKENAKIGDEIEQLEARKKASTSQFKADIESRESARRANDTSIKNGFVLDTVECEWRFECAGIDSETGEGIPHPDKKALIRKDTGEVVEVREITDDERQRSLPLEEQENTDQEES